MHSGFWLNERWVSGKQGISGNYLQGIDQEECKITKNPVDLIISNNSDCQTRHQISWLVAQFFYDNVSAFIVNKF
jgi:hypothetical protein